MDRPTKVRIAGITYDVLWKDYAWFRAADCYAQFDPILQTISIYEGIKDDRCARAFAHEVAHGFIHYRCLSGGLTEEQAADVAGYDMAQFWGDNPDVFKWWISLVSNGA